MNNANDRLNGLLVWVNVPGLKLERLNPGWFLNLFTGGILRDLLAAELNAESLLIEAPARGMQPFLGQFLFDVKDVHRAAAIVHAVFQRNTWGNLVSIYRYDQAEGVWRSLYPQGPMILTQEAIAAHNSNMAEIDEVVALWKELLSRPNPSESDASKQ